MTAVRGALLVATGLVLWGWHLAASGAPPRRRAVAAVRRAPTLPVVLRAGAGRREVIPCDVPCVWEGPPFALVHRGSVVGTNRTFVLSMEGPAHYPDVRRTGKFSIYSTGDMLSDVPCPWLNNLSDIFTREAAYDDVVRSASFIARNCRSLNRRERWVRDIQSAFPVASLGSCMHNADPWFRQGRLWGDDKRRLMRRYMFHLSFENQNEPHMTEKLYYALQAGTIPVYMGDRRAARWAPAHSFVDAHEFADGRALGSHLRRVAENRTLHASYHAWRHRPPAPHLVRFFKPFERFHVKCRLCQYARDHA